MAQTTMFFRNLVLPIIFCCRRYYGCFLISVGLNVLRSFSAISVIISFMLITIGHVRKVRHVLISFAYSRGFFESQYYINTVGYVDWASLAPDRKVWKAPQNVVMCLQIV